MDERKPNEDEEPEGRGAERSGGGTSEQERQEADDGWFKPLWRATSKADDGFVRVARSIGAAARYVEAGVVRTTGAQTKNSPAKNATARVSPRPPVGGATQPPQSPPPPAPAARTREPAPTRSASISEPPYDESAPELTRPKTAVASRGGTSAALDADGWLSILKPEDPVKAASLRISIDDWLRGATDARREALALLAPLGLRAERLILALLRGGSPEETELVLEGLKRIESDKFSSCIEQLLRVGDPEVRIVALRAAQQMGDRIARPLLSRGAEDPDPRVRRRMIPWLAWRQSPWAIERIWELGDDANPAVKWAALDVLVWQDGPEVKLRVRRARPQEQVYSRRTAALVSLFGTKAEKNEREAKEPERPETPRPKGGKSKEGRRSQKESTDDGTDGGHERGDT